MIMYTGQNIVKLAYGDRLIRPKTPKVKTLPIAYNITEAHTDFPIYIKPTAITGFGSLTLAEAQSLRFYADSAKTVELPREIVSADEIYVKNTLATGTGNKLYLDWDGVSSDYAVSDTYGARNVWNSNYKAVYHFEGNANDSTSNQNHGTATNITYDTGKLEKGAKTGSSPSISIPVNTMGTIGTGDFAISFWIKPVDPGTGKYPMLFGSFYNYSPYPGPTMFYDPRGVNGKGDVIIWRVQGGTGEKTSGNASSLYGVWNKIDFTRISGTCFGYINGVNVVSFVDNYNIPAAQAAYILSRDYDIQQFGAGAMGDEYEILTSGKPSSRISTEYANQSNPATFFGTLS